MIEYDVIVVGAGVAGASLATVLGRDGRKVLCIERSLKEPERIVGELLQPGGYDALKELGLENAVDGIDAQNVYGYGIFMDGKSLEINYCEDPGEHKDSSTGRSFHNGRFVRRLRELAAEEENVTLIEGNVKYLNEDDGHVKGVIYSDASGDDTKAFAKLTVACDGCFSRLRRMVNPAAEYEVMSQFYGLILRDLSLPFPEHGHVVLLDPAPSLFYPISSSEVRCLVDVPAEVSRAPNFDVKEHMIEKLAPQLPEELTESFITAVKRGDMKSMPNRAMPAIPVGLSGAILLGEPPVTYVGPFTPLNLRVRAMSSTGDSFNMRHPLTGGGMTVALSDVNHFRKFLRTVDDLSDVELVSSLQAYLLAERQSLSSTINILANALYSLFCANDDPALKDMKIACFDYLSKPGRWSSDPISMLGGLTGRPYLLLAHFFGVAAYACGR
mmetsp:Transcript_22052/g.89447  ORF Transcript_22052/g.89447 Transcript_22052/m.89447 type:complete len:442 (-) Transcript_22052:804-2129(-)